MYRGLLKEGVNYKLDNGDIITYTGKIGYKHYYTIGIEEHWQDEKSLRRLIIRKILPS